MLLLAVALFTIDVLEISSLRDARNTFYYCVAVNQLNNMTARLHALKNHDGFTAQFDNWNAENKLSLPQGIGEVTGSYPDYQIKIHWRKQNSGSLECLTANVTV